MHTEEHESFFHLCALCAFAVRNILEDAQGGLLL
jgi:hypothetical protein